MYELSRKIVHQWTDLNYKEFKERSSGFEIPVPRPKIIASRSKKELLPQPDPPEETKGMLQTGARRLICW